MRLSPLEGDIQAATIQALESGPYRCLVIETDAGGKKVRAMLARKGVKLPPGGVGGLPTGFPDLLVIPTSHRPVFIEIKRKGEKPDSDQVRYLDMLTKRGQIAFWADSVASALAQFDAAMKERAA